MDLRKHLLDRNLKWNWDGIATYCVKNPSAIQQIVDYCQDEEVHVQQNAGAVLGKLIDHDKELLDAYATQIVSLIEKDVHDAVKRAVMRIYQWAEISEEIEGELFEFVINALKSQEAAIAIKAFGMTVARRICEKYPELAAELIPYLEVIIEERPSSGMVNRAEKELKNLHKISNRSHL